MTEEIYIIDGQPYKMFTLDILGKTTNVASYALEDKIQEMIEHERYHEVQYISDKYEYYLPVEVDDTDEREIRESIENVMVDY